MTVTITVNARDAERELGRLAPGPTASDLLRLETVHSAVFGLTQTAVHVITGSLKTSAKISSDFRRNVWTGRIGYGGAAPGAVFNPVKYAEYEWARGGAHDFLAPALADDTDRAYLNAVLDFLRDG